MAHEGADALVVSNEEHNSEVTKLAKFFELLAKTIMGEGDVSPYLELKSEEIKTPDGPVEVNIFHMYWKEDINSTWALAQILYMDGTMQPEMARWWLPGWKSSPMSKRGRPRVSIGGRFMNSSRMRASRPIPMRR